MISKKLLMLCFLILCFASLQAQAQMVTVYPDEYDGGLSNPFKGFRPSVRGTNSYPDFNDQPYPTVHRHYIYWNDLENDESDGIQKIIDYTNDKWAGAETKNFKMIPRVILQYGASEYYWPDDLQEGNYNQPALVPRVRRMIQRLGQVWDNDPRVAWVQTGIIGKWGEQESPTGVDDTAPGTNQTWVEIMGEEFEAAFPNKLTIVRNQDVWDAEGYEWGVYWDSFAHTGQYSGSWTAILNTNALGRWMSEPIEGEIAYDWGDGRDNYGYTPTETVSTPSYYNFVINTIKQLHCSSLGWVDGYDRNSSTELGASLMQKAFAYRFVIPEFSCSRQTSQGGTLNVSFKVKNTASAPILAPALENWSIAFTLIDESTHEIVWTAPIAGNIRDWLPGDDYDWDPISNPNGSKVYLTPAQTYTINASLTVPTNIPTDNYMAGVTILEPSTGKPGVFFAVENFLKESQSHPLCRIGIGEDLSGSATVDPSIFDDPVADDARYYSLTPPGPTYTLTETSNNGSVTFNPSGGVYASGTVVTVTAVPNSGYTFSSWSGDLSGSTNPTTIIMNANKSVTANFTASSTIDAFSQIEAENFSSQSGIQTETCSEGGQNIGYIENGDYIVFNNVNFGTGAASFDARVASNTSGGSIEVRLDGLSGTLVGTCSVTGTGGWQTWVTKTCAISGASGMHNLYLKFTGGTGYLFNMNWFKFVAGTTTYTLTETSNNGSVAFNPSGGTYDEGTVVTVTAVPNSGYEFSSWSGDLSGSTNPTTITMNANKSITANFTVISSGIDAFSQIEAEGYDSMSGIQTEGCSEGGQNIGYIENGDYIVFNNVNFGTGAASFDARVASNTSGGSIEVRLDGLSGTLVGTCSVTGTGGWQTWVTKTCAISGASNTHNLYLKFTGGTGYLFNMNWFKFVASATSYTLTTSATNGSVTLNPSGGTYASGTVVTLTATPNSGYTFSSWSGDLTGSTNPTTITMNANKSVTANFTAIPTYTLTTSATNGSVTLNHSGGTYASGTVVTLTATPSSGYTFSSWSGDLTGSTNPTTITMNANKSVTANFTAIPAGGDVTALTGWVSGTTNNKVSGSNRLMTVMVMGENNGSDFSATGVTYGGQAMTKRTEKLLGTTYRTYAAIFTLGESGVNAAASGTINVTWSTTPAGSNVYSVLLGNVDQSTPVSATAQNALTGTTVSTSALSTQSGDMVMMCGATAANTTITFNNSFTKMFESNASWGDGLGGYKPGSGANETPSYTQSASGRMVICAIVARKAGATTNNTLTTTAVNGSVTPSSGTYASGTVVTLTATPNSGYTFSSWSGDLTGSTNPATITMNANKNVTANFTEESSGSNLLTNGDFSGGMSSWVFAAVSPSAATASVSSGQCLVDITNDDGTNWHIKLAQENLSLQNGTGYTASFDARAQSSRSVILQVKNASGSCLWQTFNITTTMQNYSVNFTNSVATASNFEFLLFLGAQGTNDVWIDNAVLEQNLAKASQAMNDEAAVILPQSTQLMQNYPNPFNPETTIPYQLSDASYVRLEIINFLGQQVATLVNEQQSAGLYHVKWNGITDDGKKATTGIYIYRLVTNQSTQIKKFILAK